MLHIIGLILKIIGMILVSILGLLVLLLCIFLFVPVRYKVKGSYEKQLDTLKVEVKVSWLLHLIAGHITYHHPNLKWEMRELWFKQSSDKQMNQETSYSNAEKETVKSKTTEDKLTQELDAEWRQASSLEQKQQSETQETQTKETQTPTESDSAPEDKQKKSKETLGEKYTRWKHKILGILRKIKYTFKRFCDNIKMILQKKELLQEFLTNEDHVHTLGQAKKELLYLLKHWKPRKCIVHGEVGFEDPCTTGQFLAGLSMIYPFIGEHIYITPNFQEPVLQGDFYLKGKVAVIHVVVIGIRLLLDAQVRKTVRDIRNFKW